MAGEREACCVEAAAVSIDFSSCAPGVISACTTQTATAFGTSFPFLRDGTLIPNGTRTEDSGIALNTIYTLDR